MAGPRNRGERRAAAAGARVPVNKHRGEAALRTADGKTYKLKLTLNALCEIEEHFGCAMAEVAKRLKGNPAMKDLRAFLGPMVRGGGAVVTVNDPEFDMPQTRPMTDEEIGALDFDIRSMGAAIGAVVQANFTPDGELDDAPEQAPGAAPGNA